MKELIRRPTAPIATLCMTLVMGWFSAPATAQVRVKKPDRGVYQPPQLKASAQTRLEGLDFRNLESSPQPTESLSRLQINEVVIDDPADSGGLKPLDAPGGLTLRTLPERGVHLPSQQVSLVRPVSASSTSMPINQPSIVGSSGAPSGRGLRDARGPLPHEQTLIQESAFGNSTVLGSGVWSEEPVYLDGPGCGMEIAGCDGCGYGGCDGMGGPMGGSCANATLSFDPRRWFGSAELMILFRKGDRLPALVTTDTTPGTGALPGGQILAGNEAIHKDATVGGRLTLGTWLDNQQNRSLVFRGWVAEEDSYGFSADQRSHDVLAIPFFNLGLPGEDSNVIVFPNGVAGGIAGRELGSVDVSATSEVYGGDISVRQFWTGGLGTRFDVLYGYQYMRLAEGLRINTESTLTDGAGNGSFIQISDSFDASNEFHGGQLGLAGNYREGCWSFNFLAKAAFGNVQRRAERRGNTVTGPPAGPLPGEAGFFVDSGTNEGTVTDNTFGWVPELDVSLGWHRYRHIDITVGYHVIAMTDAVQVSGIFDRNLNDPNNVQPTSNMTDDTFYMQGIHFGVTYVR